MVVPVRISKGYCFYRSEQGIEFRLSHTPDLRPPPPCKQTSRDWSSSISWRLHVPGPFLYNTRAFYFRNTKFKFSRYSGRIVVWNTTVLPENERVVKAKGVTTTTHLPKVPRHLRTRKHTETKTRSTRTAARLQPGENNESKSASCDISSISEKPVVSLILEHKVSIRLPARARSNSHLLELADRGCRLPVLSVHTSTALLCLQETIFYIITLECKLGDSTCNMKISVCHKNGCWNLCRRRFLCSKRTGCRPMAPSLSVRKGISGERQPKQKFGLQLLYQLCFTEVV